MSKSKPAPLVIDIGRISAPLPQAGDRVCLSKHGSRQGRVRSVDASSMVEIDLDVPPDHEPESITLPAREVTVSKDPAENPRFKKA